MTPMKELFNYTESVKDKYDKILFTSNFDTTHWPNWPEVTFNDYYMLHTRRFVVDSKYVLGNVSSHPIDGRTLFVARDFELVNTTPQKVFYYSNGEVAYKIID
jgi:hypothetical protein